MIARVALIACASLAGVLGQSRVVLAQAPLVVEDVRVHGNHSTPDAEVLRIAEIVVGQPLATDAVDVARARLERSGRFAHVEIRQRSRSIADPSRVALIILVSEHASVRPVDIGVPTIPGPLGRLRRQTMFLPILNVEDGYGFTYGLRTSFVGGRQSATRVSVPASWGGTRQLALEAEHSFRRARRVAGAPVEIGSSLPLPVPGERTNLGTGAVTRVRGSGGLWRQEHPYYELGQFRQYVDGEISYRPRSFFGVGGMGSLATVSFGDVDDRMTSGGIFAELDTRRDPLFPRNAVYARTMWNRVAFEHPERSGVPPGARSRWQHEVRGYAGVFRQIVLAGRLQFEQSDGPLPAYAKSILGGADTLRGIRAGFDVGDNLWAGSVEARVPITSVMRLTRFGVLAFYDTGATWDDGQRWQHRGREEGVGAGIFLINPLIQFQFSVARGLGRSTRVHVSTGISF